LTSSRTTRLSRSSSLALLETTMDEYESRIRQKLWASQILTNGEWVYLVGLFQVANESWAREARIVEAETNRGLSQFQKPR
jgi:hypothetical protein